MSLDKLCINETRDSLQYIQELFNNSIGTLDNQHLKLFWNQVIHAIKNYQISSSLFYKYGEDNHEIFVYNVPSAIDIIYPIAFRIGYITRNMHILNPTELKIENVNKLKDIEYSISDQNTNPQNINKPILLVDYLGSDSKELLCIDGNHKLSNIDFTKLLNQILYIKRENLTYGCFLGFNSYLTFNMLYDYWLYKKHKKVDISKNYIDKINITLNDLYIFQK